jgi:hypothetical protein
MSAVAAATVVAGERVFTACIMAGTADVAVTVAGFITVEVVELLIATPRQRSVIAVTRIEAVVDVAVEAARAVEPGAGSDEDAVGKPVRPVIAVRRAVIRRIVKVSVGANRGHSNAYANGDLC